MIVSIALTVGVFAGLGVAAAAGLGFRSPWTFALVAGCANVALLLGWRLGSTTRTGDAGRQRRMVSIVERTLPHMRLGLNEETALRTAQLLHGVVRPAAVGITDREKLLAFVGPGADHHHPGAPIRSRVARRAIELNTVLVANRRSDFDCSVDNGDCPLDSAVIAPLVCGTHAVGTLDVYQLTGPPDGSLIDLTRGLAGILSLQLELAQAHRASQIAETAKLDALRAQINPHFLFNMLNTISMKARTDPEEARRLLVKLSDFLRYAMKRTGHLTLLGEEYFFVRTYLFLEQARFGDRLRIRYDVDPQCLSIPVPVLTIQPLVENAVKHGIALKPSGGKVELRARFEPIGGVLRIRVSDDGVGIEPERLAQFMTVGSNGGSALANIYERLVRLYGGRASFDISSSPGKGTTVSLGLPVGND